MNRKDLPEANATCETCGHRYRVCKTCAQMRSRGIDAWRTHCDCAECYEVYIFSNMDPDAVTKEQYEHVMALELPEDRKPTGDVQKKLDVIKDYLYKDEKKYEQSIGADSNKSINTKLNSNTSYNQRNMYSSKGNYRQKEDYKKQRKYGCEVVK